jgi:UDP-N-acetylglucosamine--N-acetylmuramyl-(pentapeptide) pyrophosphoryl-undecaprenol N-acetylglucosamine transferase
MRGPAVKPIVIAAGGTGGHFFPAEALAAELVSRGHRVALMTDARAAAKLPESFAGREVFVLRGAGVAGHGLRRQASALAGLAIGAIQARAVLAKIDAAAIVGFGGYPIIAPVLATRLLRSRPPVILHDQNAVLGTANRSMARYATIMALSFEHVSRIPAGVATVVTGNPVRPAFFYTVMPGRSSLKVPLAEQMEWPRLVDPGIHGAPSPQAAPMTHDSGTDLRNGHPVDGRVKPCHDDLHLLILGGSLGARVFSDIVPAALAGLPHELRTRLRVTQQCRAEDLDRVREAYAAAAIAADLAPFITDVPARMAQATLFIGRAGGSTVAELAASGTPAILVPLPIAVNDEQGANAQALVDAGAAWIIRQPDFTPTALSGRLASLLATPGALASAGHAARSVARPNAAADLADLVLSHARVAA